VIQFVGPDSGKLRTKFVENEIISFVPVPVIENNGVTEVHGIRKQIRDRKDSFNLGFGGTVNILAEKNGRFLEIRNLTRELGEVVEDGIDGHGLSHRGLTTEDQIICQKEGVNGWTAGPQTDAGKVPVLQLRLQPDGQFIYSDNKKIR